MRMFAFVWAAAGALVCVVNVAQAAVIIPVDAIASSEYLDGGGIYGGVMGDLRYADNTWNGNGLLAGGTYGLHTRRYSASGSGLSRNPGAHWMAGELKPTITWDLGSAFNLSGFHLWNYGEQDGYETRGVKTADVLVSSDGTTFTPVLSGQEFLIAPPSGNFPGNDYTLNASDVRYVRFNVLATHGDTNFAGLSEIRFFSGIPEPSSLVLGGLGLMGLIGGGRRRRGA